MLQLKLVFISVGNFNTPELCCTDFSLSRLIRAMVCLDDRDCILDGRVDQFWKIKINFLIFTCYTYGSPEFTWSISGIVPMTTGTLKSITSIPLDLTLIAKAYVIAKILCMLEEEEEEMDCLDFWLVSDKRPSCDFRRSWNLFPSNWPGRNRIGSGVEGAVHGMCTFLSILFTHPSSMYIAIKSSCISWLSTEVFWKLQQFENCNLSNATSTLSSTSHPNLVFLMRQTETFSILRSLLFSIFP